MVTAASSPLLFRKFFIGCIATLMLSCISFANQTIPLKIIAKIIIMTIAISVFIFLFIFLFYFLYSYFITKCSNVPSGYQNQALYKPEKQCSLSRSRTFCFETFQRVFRGF